MRLSLMRLLVVVPFCLGLALIAGCPGGGMATVRGKVILPGTLKVKDGDSARIGLVSESGDKPGASSAIDPGDNTFVMRDVQPGKYKIIFHIDPYPGKEDSAKRAKEFEPLNMKYEAQKTPIKGVDVGDQNQTLTVDLDKGTVSKGG
jgi:hypothetical protein